MKKQDQKDPKEFKNNTEVVLSQEEFDSLKEQAQKAQENWDKFLRAQAELDNAAKRFEKQRQDYIKFAQEEIISDLLVSLDDLERTVTLAEKGKQDFPAFLKGVEMILAHLFELLKKQGVEPINAKGEKFNPHMHEALLQEETEGVQEGMVLEELQKGYKLNGRVIRTAKVKIAASQKSETDNPN